MADVRVVRVGSIPFGLSVLVDERPGSLVVWLLESDWPEPSARRVEQILRVRCALQANAATTAQLDLHAV